MLHLVSVVTAQRGVKALEFGVSAVDNSWSLVTAAGLDHMDGVELERSIDRLHISQSLRRFLVSCHNSGRSLGGVSEAGL